MSRRLYLTTYNAQRFQDKSGAAAEVDDEEGSWASSFTHGLTILEEHETPEEEFLTRVEEIFPKADGWVNRQAVADRILLATHAGPYTIRWSIEDTAEGDTEEGAFGEHIELGDYLLPPGSDTGELP